MDDLVVDAGADGGRVGAVIAKERRDGIRVTDHLLGDAVQLQGRDPGPELRMEDLQDLRQDAAGVPHGLDLLGALDGDHSRS